MQFSAKIWSTPPAGVGAPPVGNSGSATGWASPVHSTSPTGEFRNVKLIFMRPSKKKRRHKNKNSNDYYFNHLRNKRLIGTLPVIFFSNRPPKKWVSQRGSGYVQRGMGIPEGRGGCVQGASMSRGRYPLGHEPWRVATHRLPPSGGHQNTYSWQAGTTHPTRMLSCFLYVAHSYAPVLCSLPTLHQHLF